MNIPGTSRATKPLLRRWRTLQDTPSYHIRGKRTSPIIKTSTTRPAVVSKATRNSRSFAVSRMKITRSSSLGRTRSVSTSRVARNWTNRFVRCSHGHRKAAICIAYAGQTNSLLDLAADRWFTRGWTLQELLAPLRFKFYNKDWFPLTDFPNDKIHEEDARNSVLTATGVEPRHFRDFEPGFRNPSLPERMRWVARRLTTRAEDKSYCMTGIFGVSMLVAYGEGPERAFFRLFQAILDVACQRHWFLWAGKA
ncbi:hypothetical protein BKA82DRAFT_940691, partial [Pisolithus tinctorius]